MRGGRARFAQTACPWMWLSSGFGMMSCLSLALWVSGEHSVLCLRTGICSYFYMGKRGIMQMPVVLRNILLMGSLLTGTLVMAEAQAVPSLDSIKSDAELTKVVGAL